MSKYIIYLFISLYVFLYFIKTVVQCYIPANATTRISLSTISPPSTIHNLPRTSVGAEIQKIDHTSWPSATSHPMTELMPGTFPTNEISTFVTESKFTKDVSSKTLFHLDRIIS